MGLARARTSLEIDGILDFECYSLAQKTQIFYTNSINLCKTLRKYLSRHVKEIPWLVFTFAMVHGQKLGNSESEIDERNENM